MHQILIKLEGRNGSGKSLLMKYLAKQLCVIGYDVVLSNHHSHKMVVGVRDLGKIANAARE